jgi:hypothetical protein
VSVVSLSGPFYPILAPFPHAPSVNLGDGNTVVAAHEALADLGLAPSRKKGYVGPANGRWSFAGLVFEHGRAAPKPGAISRLMSGIAAAFPMVEKMRNSMAGWAGQYLPALTSFEVIRAGNLLREKYGKEVPDLVSLMAITAARTRSWRVPLPGQQAGVFERMGPTDQPGNAQADSQGYLYHSESSEMFHRAAEAGHNPPSQEAGAGSHPKGSSSPPGTFLNRPPDPINLVACPQRFPRLREGELLRHAGRSGCDFILWSEYLGECLQRGRYAVLGCANAREFITGHLAADPRQVRRIIEIAGLAREVFQLEDLDQPDPPIGLIKALLHVKSELPWVRNFQRSVLMQLVADGEVSVRQAKKTLRRSLRRARRIARLAQGDKIRHVPWWRIRRNKQHFRDWLGYERRCARARWTIWTRDGQLITVEGYVP